MKIVILDGYALNPGDLSYEPLRQFGELTIYDRTDTEDEAVARIADSEIVLVNKLPVTERLLDACPSIRLICVQATGYNTVDCAACARRGIPVTNVPTYGTAAVAQFTFALMLELCHRVAITTRWYMLAGGKAAAPSASGTPRRWSWPGKRWALSASGASVRPWRTLPAPLA